MHTGYSNYLSLVPLSSFLCFTHFLCYHIQSFHANARTQRTPHLRQQRKPGAQPPGFPVGPSPSARRQAPSTLSNSCYVQPGAAGSLAPATAPNFFSSFLRPQITHIPDV